MIHKNVKYKHVYSMLFVISFLCFSLLTPLQQTTLASVDENISMFGGKTSNSVSNLPPIFVEKLVWNGADWVNSAEVNEADIVHFKVIIYNPYDSYEIHWSGVIYDEMPCNLQYIPGSTTLPLEYGNPHLDPEVIDTGNNSVLWHVDKESFIPPHQYLNFTYSARAICCGDSYLCNILTVSPSELIHICDPEDIITNDGSLDVSDSASVKVICIDNPDVTIEKRVKKNGYWMETVTIFEGDDVDFQIVVTNTGSVNLSAVEIVDNLPGFLIYNYDANVSPSSASDHQITWIIPFLAVGDDIEITFSAHAIDSGIDYNSAVVHTCQGVSDSDTAQVIVAGMIIDKKVRTLPSGSWVDEVDAAVGETVRFKITITYIGNGSYTLYNFRIRDELPECLDYANSANPTETCISGDGRIIWWNLSASPGDGIHAGGHYSIEFNALITETSGCGPCINLANVTAHECSGHIFTGEDTATVNAECPLIADAKGPYYADIDETIFIHGSATGGTPPYIYKWDLDDDGYFDDATGETCYESWDEDGTYVIRLKVTDAELRTDTDTATVVIAPPDNQAPDEPSRPQGDTQGIVGVTYEYTTHAEDPNDDIIRYGWDWNGDAIVDEWTGYYASDTTITIDHIWTSAGTFTIRVKAEDEHGLESDFSTALTIQISQEHAPNKPTLTGPSSGRIGNSYTYAATCTDPDGDQIYYWFDWGDGSNSGWKGPYSSGQTASESHSWSVVGSYSVKVKAKDNTAESIWSESIPVSMPKVNIWDIWSFFSIIEWFAQYFPFFHSLFF